MKRSPFAIVSLLLGIAMLLLIVVFMIVYAWELNDDHPLTFIAFAFSALVATIERPARMIGLSNDYPITIPLLAAVATVVSVLRNEPLKRLALAGCGLMILSIGLLMTI